MNRVLFATAVLAFASSGAAADTIGKAVTLPGDQVEKNRPANTGRCVQGEFQVHSINPGHGLTGRDPTH